MSQGNHVLAGSHFDNYPDDDYFVEESDPYADVKEHLDKFSRVCMSRSEEAPDRLAAMIWRHRAEQAQAAKHDPARLQDLRDLGVLING